MLTKVEGWGIPYRAVALSCNVFEPDKVTYSFYDSVYKHVQFTVIVLQNYLSVKREAKSKKSSIAFKSNQPPTHKNPSLISCLIIPLFSLSLPLVYQRDTLLNLTTFLLKQKRMSFVSLTCSYGLWLHFILLPRVTIFPFYNSRFKIRIKNFCIFFVIILRFQEKLYPTPS